MLFRKIVAGMSISGLLMVPFVLTQKTYAACGATFYIGDKTTCIYSEGVTDGQFVDGFSYDKNMNKIVLNNYNGPAIYYVGLGFDEIKEMTVELNGLNVIDASLYPNVLEDMSDINVGFYNIMPSFTGSGKLEIQNAYVPVGRGGEQLAMFRVVGNETEKQVQTIVSETVQEEVDAKDEVKVEAEVEDGYVLTTGEIESDALSVEREKSFFETTVGLVVLITVPSVLLLIILVLSILLVTKYRKAKAPEDSMPMGTGQISG